MHDTMMIMKHITVPCKTILVDDLYMYDCKITSWTLQD